MTAAAIIIALFAAGGVIAGAWRLFFRVRAGAQAEIKADSLESTLEKAHERDKAWDEIDRVDGAIGPDEWLRRVQEQQRKRPEND